jgi:hypothetical protein
MLNILKRQNGMSIVGQGGEIILVVLPAFISAILLHVYFPKFVFPGWRNLWKSPAIGD